MAQQSVGLPPEADVSADVVIVGSGATGLPAAIAAADAGASVLVVETNYDVGGHAIISGGNVPLGDGTSAQREYGIEDSPDTVFADLTDWSVVQVNGFPDYRYSDRAVIRAFADHCAETYEFLLANGVKFKEIPPDSQGAHSTGNSAHRENHTYYKSQTPPFHAAWGTTAGSHAPRGQPFVLECRPPFVLTLYVMVRHRWVDAR